MSLMRRTGCFVSILMTFILLAINLPVHPAFAIMVATETVRVDSHEQSARENVRAFLDRREIQSLLSAGGIDALEAQKRVDCLSDAEVGQIAAKLDQFPAGRDFGGTLVYVAFIALLVLLITELLGYTDIF